MDVANVAAQIMEHLCTCKEHGYSQPGRKGTKGTCAVKTDAGTVYVTKGDRDCSSAVIEAWKLALGFTEYAGKLDKATYTGDMRSVFKASGLFEVWDTSKTHAVRGDVYLNDAKHTAMCLDGSASHDVLGEFSISENGTIDGEPGDQTGKESRVRAYYDYPWNCTLHYNGKADKPAVKGTVYTVKRDVWKRSARDTSEASQIKLLKCGTKVTVTETVTSESGAVWGRLSDGCWVCLKGKPTQIVYASKA